jgi:hypothetical protein
MYKPPTKVQHFSMSTKCSMVNLALWLKSRKQRECLGQGSVGVRKLIDIEHAGTDLTLTLPVTKC